MSNELIKVTALNSLTVNDLADDPARGTSLSLLGEIPQSMEFNLFEALDGLINGWCERRALRPLRYLLRAYPGVLEHTDQQFQLLEALKNVKAFCRNDIASEELRLITQAHNYLEERLRTRVI